MPGRSAPFSPSRGLGTTYDARQYPGFYNGAMDQAITPGFTERPVPESFDGSFHNSPATKFTVQQGMVELTYKLGCLAAWGFEPCVEPPGPVEPLAVNLDNGEVRNPVALGADDLTTEGFDVDGDGTRTSEADFLSPVAALRGGRERTPRCRERT